MEADSPIQDSESLSESPQSFDPESGDEDGVSVTIVHHNGVAEVSDFTTIEEIDVEGSILRVWHYGLGPSYTDYYAATITEVSQ